MRDCFFFFCCCCCFARWWKLLRALKQRATQAELVPREGPCAFPPPSRWRSLCSRAGEKRAGKTGTRMKEREREQRSIDGHSRGAIECFFFFSFVRGANAKSAATFLSSSSRTRHRALSAPWLASEEEKRKARRRREERREREAFVFSAPLEAAGEKKVRVIFHFFFGGSKASRKLNSERHHKTKKSMTALDDREAREPSPQHGAEPTSAGELSMHWKTERERERERRAGNGIRSIYFFFSTFEAGGKERQSSTPNLRTASHVVPPPRIQNNKNLTGDAAEESTRDPKEGKVEKEADGAPTTVVAPAAADDDDDDREEPPPPPPPKPKPNKPCSSCGAESKYQCPRCGERSCSATCVGKHKEATGEFAKRETRFSSLSFFFATFAAVCSPENLTKRKKKLFHPQAARARGTEPPSSPSPR